MKTYAFAIVPSSGMYASGDVVRVEEFADSLQVARQRATRLTDQYRGRMARYGGSNGGYRVISWDYRGDTITGRILDSTPDARDAGC